MDGSNIMISVLGIGLAILYVKPVFLLLTTVFIAAEDYYIKHKDCKLGKLLHIPRYIDQHTFNLYPGSKRYALIEYGYIPSIKLRHLIYKAIGVSMGKNVVFHYRTELRAPEYLAIGEGSIIGDNALLDCRRGLKIGKHVNISSNVSIYTLQHDHRDPLFALQKPERNLKVEIHDRVWIGANVVILPGVTIGEGAVCCAGAIVTKDVEPYTIVAGIPAKKVNERTRDLKYEFDGSSRKLIFY